MAMGVVILIVIAACSSASGDTTSTISPVTTVAPETTTTIEEADMEISSPAFNQGEAIPVKFSCDGEDVSPQLDISAIPEATTSLALILDDTDAPGGTWDHWIAYDIAPVGSIAEGDDGIGTGGLNSWQMTGYGGPCPPSGTHRYFFKLYALDAELGLADGATKTDLTDAMKGHILAEAELLGVFTRG
jgi:Raf kinase inhibitor-like YbhB/YbcL family protein